MENVFHRISRRVADWSFPETTPPLRKDYGVTVHEIKLCLTYLNSKLS